MRFPGRSRANKAPPYTLFPPYAEARAGLLARRPPAGFAFDARVTDKPERLFEVVVDVALDDYLVSVYLFADGTISIYSTAGIHSTGLHGAPKVAAAAEAILEEVEQSLGRFTRVEDMAALPLPERGESQVLARAWGGDFAASERFHSKREKVAVLASMALLLTRLARAAIVEGFDRAEVGEARYDLAPEYRRLRSALMDWNPAPAEVGPDARIASVAVEFGDADTQTVTSLFAFADGSASLYRSDGVQARDLHHRPGVEAAVRGLLDAVETALPAFEPAELIAPPQPDRVQFVARARIGKDAEWVRLVAVADRTALAEGSHQLSDAFVRANDVLEIAV